MSQRTWLKNATLVTMNAAAEVVEGDLLIEDGRIAVIGQVDEARAEGARVLDMSGHIITPGFVQCHIHLCQTLMRNHADDMVLIDWLKRRIWPYEAALTHQTLGVSARVGLAELILGGTTAILDMGTVHHTDAIGEAVEESGIRAHIGKCMMDLGDEVPAPMREVTAESLKESLRLYDTWHGKAEGRIQYAFAPRFAVSCTEELLREVGQASRDLGCHIHTHASETTYENVFTQERYGVSNIAFLEQVGITGSRSVLAHGVHVSDEDCQILSTTKTCICHCPSSNLKLASGIANIPRYDNMGVRVALGADGAPCNNNLDAFIEMRLAALLQKPFHGPEVMPAERVLRLATMDGARALGIDDKVGSLEVGKSADLVVFDLDNDPGCGPGGDVYARLVYTAQKHNVRHVFASGRQLVDKGELVGVDLGQLMARARQAHHETAERMQQFISG
ncbi:5'-deoxyadenosine deaminase [Lujinxingia sediminis]|uniref:5'-deoxyadenosine deaminase n=1 Tax=Lujinxingia sediminis TaxID=2480984 RepID=A0ABY0CNS1_9DELT|nr:5'-deoxyadenosine deaminase [Lujinxingia sediminis]RVU41018.1 5'-deoxyadenosine deaminase [Lujinxingia sediminis]